MNNNSWMVYVHINKTNSKRYVGITSRKNPYTRWRQNGEGYKENPHFYSAIQKYGWENFDHVILCHELSESIAKDLEKHLINKWNTTDRRYGYNMTCGGEGSLGYHPSDETRKKMAIHSMKENLSEETLKKRSERLRGRKFSDEHKRKIGDGNSKPINMFNKSGDFIRSFSSAKEAEVELGINHSHISQCCNGFRNTTGGYKWKFA